MTHESSQPYDAVIAGGGPAGLSAALALGRARKRVLLCDSGVPRNAAAVHMQNFVSRDGIPPAEFRRISRQQLRTYPNVEVRDERVLEISGERGAFAIRFAVGLAAARRVILCTGMIDEIPAIDGVSDLWGTSIFQCPYCHGWESQDRRFAYLAANPEAVPFALLLRGWSHDIVVLTGGAFAIADEQRASLQRGGVRIEEDAIRRLTARGPDLTSIELAGGRSLERDVIFMHPAQRQVDLVRELGVALNDKGFVEVDDLTRETSIPGIYAAGDLAAQAQGGQAAVLSAAAGMRAAAALNHALTTELAVGGALG